MTKHAHTWSLMRPADAPDDAAGALVLKDGLAWLAVRRGLTWPEDGMIDIIKMAFTSTDMMELLAGSKAKGKIMLDKIGEKLPLGVIDGVHWMTRAYVFGNPDPWQGKPGKADVTLAMDGTIMRGTVVIAVLPPPARAREVGFDPSQPMAFHAGRLRAILASEVASMKANPGGRCAWCHATTECKCEENERVPLIGQPGEAERVRRGREIYDESQIDRKMATLFRAFGFDSNEPEGSYEGDQLNALMRAVCQFVAGDRRILARAIKDGTSIDEAEQAARREIFPGGAMDILKNTGLIEAFKDMGLDVHVIDLNEMGPDEPDEDDEKQLGKS